MPIDINKYQVTKTETNEALPLDDVFVLRGKDIFALGALRSYLDKILFTLELDAAGTVVIDDDTRKHLHDLADFVYEMAEKWERRQASARIPD